MRLRCSPPLVTEKRCLKAAGRTDDAGLCQARLPLAVAQYAHPDALVVAVSWGSPTWGSDAANVLFHTLRGASPHARSRLHS